MTELLSAAVNAPLLVAEKKLEKAEKQLRQAETRIITLQDQVNTLREALEGIHEGWVRCPDGLTDFGEREHYLHLANRFRDAARVALLQESLE